MLTESLLLGGGVVGVLLAVLGTPLLVALVPGRVPGLEAIGMDARVLGFTLLVALLTAVLFGWIPGLQASVASAHKGLRQGALGSRGRLLTMRVSLPPPAVSKYQTDTQVSTFYDDVLRRVGDVPGVVSASGVEEPPLNRREIQSEISIPGRDLRPIDEKLTTDQRYVTDGYFRTLGIPLLQGRTASWDEWMQGKPVAVINTTMAQRFWPEVDPLGQGYHWGLQDLESADWDPRYPPDVYFEVVGEVNTVGLDHTPGPQAYVPFRKFRTMDLVIRTSGDSLNLVNSVAAAIEAVDDDEAQIARVATMKATVASLLVWPRFYMWLIAFLRAVSTVSPPPTHSHSLAYPCWWESQRSWPATCRPVARRRSGPRMRCVTSDRCAPTTGGARRGRPFGSDIGRLCQQGWSNSVYPPRHVPLTPDRLKTELDIRNCLRAEVKI